MEVIIVENKEKSLPSTSINWYPGHMAKAKKQIIEDLKLIDIIVEVLDARIPKSSKNPDIEEYIKSKKRVIALNKSDLADEVQNKKWIEYFNKNNIPAVLIEANSGKGINEIIRKIEEVNITNKEYYSQKGRTGKKIRVLVLGIPNVGKSSFINRITKKNVAQVGNKPGVTKQKQWVRVNENIELLDTPGVLWPKFENNETALNLAFTGSIKDDILEKVEIGYELLKYLLENEFDKLIERYKLNKEEIETELQNTERMENENILEIMNIIGKKRGAIVSGGVVDLKKVSDILIEEFRSGKLGRISLEKC
jgi:ribosome biogenesis GTPase A